MIGFNENTSEVGGGKFIDVTKETAIRGGRFIQSITVGDYEGQPYLDVVVVDREEKTANKRFFEPKEGGTYTDTPEKFTKETNKLLKVTANLVRRFKGEKAVLAGATWKEYFENVKKAVEETPGWNKKELRVKVILRAGKNKDGDIGYYPTLPGYAPVFEDITIPISETKLRVGQYDMVVVPQGVTPDPIPGTMPTESDVTF